MKENLKTFGSGLILFLMLIPFVILFAAIIVTAIVTAALVIWTFQVNFLYGLVALIAAPILYRILLTPFAILWGILAYPLKNI